MKSQRTPPNTLILPSEAGKRSWQPLRRTATVAASFVAGAVVELGILTVGASPSASAHYVLEPSGLDFGGGRSASLAYAHFGSADLVGRTNVASAHFTLAAGYFGALADFLGGSSFGYYVFYNNSVWDGAKAAANADDDKAIAPDKVALLPGRTATFANYTSYSRGINGVMVDIASLPGTPTISDFVFNVGNDANVSNWALGPAPLDVTVRLGAGVSGSDRITLIWADSAIKKQWLEVRVKSTPATGLAADEVFFFGNAMGDTGDAPAPNGRVRVDTSDLSAVRFHPRNLINNPAPISDPYDFNRDRRVDTSDLSIVRFNPTTFVDGLLLFAPSSGNSLLSLDTASGLESGLATAPGTPERSPVLHASVSEGKVVAIEFQGTPNAEFRLETTDDLGRGMWQRVPEFQAYEGHLNQYAISLDPSVRQQFFRLAVKPSAVP